jgi:hypothetical protein
MPGGSSLPVYDKANKQWIVKARAINFPILIHEIVKGIYSVIGSRGWSKNKALNQASVASVDKLRNEPDDLRYGKFMLDAISDAINKFYNKSNVSDPYVRDVFMAKLVELPYSQLRDFIQNAINDELSAGQEKWAKDTISKISSLKEYKINKPSEPWEQYGSYKKELEDSYDEFEINSWEDLMAENDGWGDMVPDFGKEIFLKTGLELKGEAWEALDTYCQYLSHLFIIKYSIEKGLIDKDNPKYQKELKNKSENVYYFREKWQQYNSSLKEYKINTPNQYDGYTEELIEFFKKDTLFKGFDKILTQNYSKILDNVWEWYKDVYKEYEDEEEEDDYESDIEVPQNKNELLTKPTGGTTDSFYRVINGFLFPYMAVYLKKKDWDWEEDTEFSKNGKTVDMFDYIKPFEEYDTSPKEMSWESFIEYLDDNWNNI